MRIANRNFELRCTLTLAALASACAVGCSASGDGAPAPAGVSFVDSGTAPAPTQTHDGAAPGSADATVVPADDAAEAGSGSLAADASGAGDTGPGELAESGADAATDAPPADSSGGVVADAGTGGDSGHGPLVPLTVYLAGDSTVSTYDVLHAPQTGWGQVLAPYFKPLAKVSNQAIGGRTARRYIEEGYLATILGTIKAGDYLLVQFGTNDSNSDPAAVYGPNRTPYYTDPAAFQTYLKQYIDGARAHGANPVLVTPPPQRTCAMDGGDSFVFDDSRFIPYVNAMNALGAQTTVPVVDLNKRALDYLQSIGCIASSSFFLVAAPGQYAGVYAGGVSDHTHFQKAGAVKLAGFVADSIRALGLPLAAYLN